MPRQLNIKALRSVKESALPEARPPRSTQILNPMTGSYEYGEEIPGEAIPGTLPHIEIPHYEFPKCVYKPPFKWWVPRIVVRDGHGNREWQWIANDEAVKVVSDEKELKEALKAGWQAKPTPHPPKPEEDPEMVGTEVKTA